MNDPLKHLKEEWRKALRNPWYVAAWVLLGVFIFGQHANATEYSVYVGGDTITNNSQDTIQIGLSVEWEHVVLEFAHGRKRVGWRVSAEPDWKQNEWQGGSTFAARFYPFHNERCRPLIIWTHVSDILRGRPFNDEDEPTADFYGLGLTYDINLIEIDVAVGRFNRECALFRCASSSASTEGLLRFRFNFWSSK